MTNEQLNSIRAVKIKQDKNGGKYWQKQGQKFDFKSNSIKFQIKAALLLI